MLTELSAHREPVTAERLAELLPSIHVSSVYRALAVLEEEGVVAHVHLGHGPAVYQLADDARLVRHLVCESCGDVVLVPVAVFEPVRAVLERDFGFALDVDHFAVIGRCRACTGQQAAPSNRQSD